MLGIIYNDAMASDKWQNLSTLVNYPRQQSPCRW